VAEEVFRYGRVVAHTGKHGDGDFRLSIQGIAPTHGELLALLCGILKAESRYDGRNGDSGRYRLWTYIDDREPLYAKEWEDIAILAALADSEKKTTRSS
jgi:hypothetical protein